MDIKEMSTKDLLLMLKQMGYEWDYVMKPRKEIIYNKI